MCEGIRAAAGRLTRRLSRLLRPARQRSRFAAAERTSPAPARAAERSRRRARAMSPVSLDASCLSSARVKLGRCRFHRWQGRLHRLQVQEQLRIKSGRRRVRRRQSFIQALHVRRQSCRLRRVRDLSSCRRHSERATWRCQHRERVLSLWPQLRPRHSAPVHLHLRFDLAARHAHEQHLVR